MFNCTRRLVKNIFRDKNVALSWSTQMLIWLSLPPHPEYQGGIDKYRNLSQIWKERLNNLIPLDYYWIKHQNWY
jgi:hypothetical protein